MFDRHSKRDLDGNYYLFGVSPIVHNKISPLERVSGTGVESGSRSQSASVAVVSQEDFAVHG